MQAFLAGSCIKRRMYQLLFSASHYQKHNSTSALLEKKSHFFYLKSKKNPQTNCIFSCYPNIFQKRNSIFIFYHRKIHRKDSKIFIFHKAKFQDKKWHLISKKNAETKTFFLVWKITKEKFHFIVWMQHYFKLIPQPCSLDDVRSELEHKTYWNGCSTHFPIIRFNTSCT